MSESNGKERPALAGMLLATGTQRKRVEVLVDGCPEPIVILETNTGERIAWWDQYKKDTGDEFDYFKMGGWLLTACLSDSSGARLFPLDRSGYDEVMRLNRDVFNQLTKAAVELHEIFDGASEQREKKSETLQSDDSCSSSASSMESPLESLQPV